MVERAGATSMVVQRRRALGASPRGALVALLSLVLAVLLGTACSLGAPERVIVTLDGVEVIAEVADQAAERAHGLQDHEPLEPGEGMLFIFEDSAPRTFAMKEVAFPIDVVFIDDDLIVRAIEPLDPGDERLVTSPCPCAYVLELPQGWAASRDIGPGSAFGPPR
jgi:hypothetical protein